ncbi:hypothetical protein [Vreelandella alkaliphila]|uniref:Uncharacterized protein n=1 Tax=Vreelandella alkaliphila TaxID=272774 RepID=A0AAJ2S466_9GAMM|nr:hypothetical protein [Halomonas alkaliphila]MDX5979561.1 hypothetical protein [Halomonas alkaliphila]
MDANNITLNAEETSLFVEAVSAASAIYHRAATLCTPGIPAFGVDDQPAAASAAIDPLACNAYLLLLGELRALKKALTSHYAKHSLIAGLDCDDRAQWCATIQGDNKPDSTNFLLLSAILAANVKARPGRKTLALLERLL